MLYDAVLISVVQQQGSAVSIHSPCESLQFALSFTVVDIRETWMCLSGLNHVFMCSYFTSGTKICIKEAEAVGAL